MSTCKAHTLCTCTCTLKGSYQMAVLHEAVECTRKF